MARKKTEAGVAALVDEPEQVSIQDIRMLDWYAAFALMDLPIREEGQEALQAKKAFDMATAMMKEREKYI